MGSIPIIRCVCQSVVQPGSIPVLGTGGRWFKSSRSDLCKKSNMNHKLIISLKSNDRLNLVNSQKKLQFLFNELNKTTKTPSSITLPNQKSYITVLRSPHIDKKSREQFVYKTTKSNIWFNFSNLTSLNLFIFALNQIEIPGVEVKVTSKEWKYLSI